MSQSEKERYQFIHDVLNIFSETDCYSDLYWQCEENAVKFYVIVNDIFYWATADMEPILPEDLPAIRQAVADVQAIVGSDIGISQAYTLWAARKRGMRPQQPAYPSEQRLRELFDKCGPARTDA